MCVSNAWQKQGRNQVTNFPWIACFLITPGRAHKRIKSMYSKNACYQTHCLRFDKTTVIRKESLRLVPPAPTIEYSPNWLPISWSLLHFYDQTSITRKKLAAGCISISFISFPNINFVTDLKISRTKVWHNFRLWRTSWMSWCHVSFHAFLHAASKVPLQPLLFIGSKKSLCVTYWRVELRSACMLVSTVETIAGEDSRIIFTLEIQNPP